MLETKDEKLGKRSGKLLWIVYAVLIVSLLLFALVSFADDWLESKLKSTVAKKSNGVYTLSVKDAGVRLFAGEIILDSVQLQPGFKRWQELADTSKIKTLYNVEARRIRVDGLSFLNLLFKNPLRLKILQVNNTTVRAYRMLASKNDEKQKPLHEQLNGRFKGLSLDSVSIDTANFYSYSNYQSNTPDMAVEGFNVSISDIAFDSSTYNNEKRVLYAKKVIANADNINFLMSKGFYRIKTGPLALDSGSGSLEIAQLRLVPVMSAAEMSRQAGRAVTRFKGSIPKISIKNMDIDAFMRSSDLIMDNILLEQPDFEAFMDLKHFNRKGNKPMPQEVVQNYQGVLDIGKIEVNNLNIRYEEIHKKADKRGVITFEDSDITVTNFTNIADKISTENPAIVKAKVMIMGKGKLDFTIRMPLLDKNYSHEIEGTLGAFDPAILNPILEPSSFVTIESGKVHRGNFRMKLDKTSGTGTMKVLYNNLEVELLSKKAGVRQTAGQEVISEVINWVALKEANPSDKGEKPRVAQVRINRDPNRSVFNYWKNIFADGFLVTLGLQKRAEKL